jgi:L-ascorbate metabolism protein UlaG (beta-lactamase superfamily)
LLVDPLLNERLWGLSIGDLLAPLGEPEGSCDVLVTHLHQDHFDPLALDRALDLAQGGRGSVVCAEGVAATVASRGYPVRPMRLWEPQRLGPFTVAAVPAVDGFGIQQVSWVIRGYGKRWIHCGDTLWHGHWWQIAQQLGPFDAAFLPVNGFRYQGRDPDVDVPSSLTPEQAVAAARILGAQRLVPIHYGLRAAFYAEEPEIEERLVAAAREAELELTFLAPGELLDAR